MNNINKKKKRFNEIIKMDHQNFHRKRNLAILKETYNTEIPYKEKYLSTNCAGLLYPDNEKYLFTNCGHLNPTRNKSL